MTSNAAALDDRWGEDAPPAAILKGTARGLEIVVEPAASDEAVAAALTRRLDEAPGFFRGSAVRVRWDGDAAALAPEVVARIHAIAARFELVVVEVGPRKPRVAEASAPVVAPMPAPVPVALPLSPSASVPAPPPALDPPEMPEISIFEGSVPVAVVAPPPPERTRMVVGPVRSGVILDHPGHVVVLGDVNPGAEVRAEGNIIILGRLRGIAHAGIGGEHGFILALRLEPQQLRIGRLVARAPESHRRGKPADGAELAHVTAKSIVVERYTGKLPFGLAAGI